MFRELINSLQWAVDSCFLWKASLKFSWTSPWAATYWVLQQRCFRFTDIIQTQTRCLHSLPHIKASMQILWFSCCRNGLLSSGLSRPTGNESRTQLPDMCPSVSSAPPATRPTVGRHCHKSAPGPSSLIDWLLQGRFVLVAVDLHQEQLSFRDWVYTEGRAQLVYIQQYSTFLVKIPKAEDTESLHRGKFGASTISLYAQKLV